LTLRETLCDSTDVPAPPGLSETTTRTAVDLRRLPWIKPLAADYAAAFPRLADFFAGNPADAAVWREAIARTSRHPRERERLADVVLAQQQARHAPTAAMAAGLKLRDPGTVAVVTGQQAGLFGGPVFTLLKALTALRLAERAAIAHQIPAVAVFWVDAEDQDWDEIKSCAVLDASMNPVEITIGERSRDPGGPIALARLDGSVQTALDALGAALAPTEFTPGLLEGLRQAYGPGTGVATAFARWLEGLLGPRGLIVFDPSDPASKPLASPIFAREIEHLGETSRLAAEAGAALVARGYHAQVTPTPGQAAVFHLGNGQRSPIRTGNDGGVTVGETTTTREAVAKLARVEPAQFSPNVLLRPIVQDTLFPTICYVAGPSELAYLAQLRQVYAAFGVPMPLVQPRATATILDANATRFLQRYEVPFEALRPRDEAALNQLLKTQMPPAVDASLDEAERAIAERLTHVAAALATLDQTLDAAARSAQGRMQDELKKLRGKALQAAKRKDETLRRQFAHAQAQAFPGGAPQERAIGFVYFLNKYGPTLVDRLQAELPLDDSSHWVVTI
jgi:bacillithiol biosynthesis cysteine-adding enzyme BshC